MFKTICYLESYNVWNFLMIFTTVSIIVKLFVISIVLKFVRDVVFITLQKRRKIQKRIQASVLRQIMNQNPCDC